MSPLFRATQSKGALSDTLIVGIYGQWWVHPFLARQSLSQSSRFLKYPVSRWAVACEPTICRRSGARRRLASSGGSFTTRNSEPPPASGAVLKSSEMQAADNAVGPVFCV